MSEKVYMNKEWHGLPVPEYITTPLPTAAELVHLCNKTHELGYTSSLTYPPDAKCPTYWIKYGSSVIWNELASTKMAYEGLRSLGSPVRVPAVYYGCRLAIPHKDNPSRVPVYRTYLVMEYVKGQTAEQLLQDAGHDEEKKDSTYKQIAFALSELHRIPVPEGARPAAVNGGRIRHELFDENQASLHYRNVTELEDHFNLILSLTKARSRVENLAREPMVFCYSDVWLGNFMFDDEGAITVVDLEDASILPSSFSRFVLAGTRAKIDRDISDMVVVPKTEGVDNTTALFAVARPMVTGSGSLATAGRKLLGNYERDEPDQVHKVVKDAQGLPVIFAIEPTSPLQYPTFTGPPSPLPLQPCLPPEAGEACRPPPPLWLGKGQQ
ncbi:Aminoglycoside phosphotransferase [Metarhizium album ARSEF 1941]|uniref:Aminoglycoside phosphotransferase n=1 Tax=Metarhizium album (strain ARSEF 1941) TaxID=1081103 RepID=A0A0B2X8M6_METAS|nr:Aminoglycoside phosphotransferase [Metarhizium album ARSEF 1941]KHO01885.1 Aminoglycoside phosphotransferase [Metarhizium album ARSEF 1941]